MIETIKESFIYNNKEIKNNNENLTKDDILKFKNIAEKSYNEIYNYSEKWIGEAK